MSQNLNQRWNVFYSQGLDFTLAKSQEISGFLGHVDPKAPKTALDIGCGTGQLTRELYHRGYQVVGIDASTSAIQTAKSLTTVPVEELSYLDFDIEYDDLGKLPHGSYGLITCKLVYAFIKDKPAFLEKVNLLLAPGGVFVVITPLPKDVPPEKQGIAATGDAMSLLDSVFERATLYSDRGLTYFVGRAKQAATMALGLDRINSEG